MVALQPPQNLDEFLERAWAVLRKEADMEAILENPLGHIVEIRAFLTSYAKGGGEPAVLLKWFEDFLVREDERSQEVKKLEANMPKSLAEFVSRARTMTANDSELDRELEFPLEAASKLLPFLRIQAESGGDEAKALYHYYLRVLKNPELATEARRDSR